MSKSAPSSRWLVSTDWLAERLRDPRLVVVDGSWYMPADNRDGFEEYLAAHIPGAVFFDIDEIADHSRGLPHMLPPPHVFELHMTRLGIDNGMQVVVYDGAGLFPAPRVWWTFRVFGMENVFILDGGFPKWRAEARPVEADMVAREPAHFTANFNQAMVAGLDRMKKTLVDRSAQVVDSRSAERFRGEAPEPRAGVRSGHMPGSLNLPSSKLVENGMLAPPQKIAAAVATKRLGRQHQIDTYFHCLHGRLKLRQIDGLRAELIAYARADAEGPKPSDYRLAPIAHPETLKTALTAALGVRAVVEKQREIFLHHNVRIHLDDVAGLGRFIEFEAVLKSASDEAAARALLDHLMRQFALAPADLLPGSYGEMS